MPTIDAHTPGSFCWSELVTSDVDASLVFYGALFDWEADITDLGDASRYVRCTLKGRPVAAMVQMSAEECSFEVKPYWASYVHTVDVSGTIAQIEALGGRRFEDPIEVPDAGVLGEFEDPQGARLCLWQPAGFDGSGWQRELGTPVWWEILTRDVEGTSQFYSELLDWRASTRDMGETTYTSFLKDGEGKAGIQAMDTRFDGIPAQWMMYVAVPNIRNTIEAATALDAKVVIAPTELDGVGTYATLRDPQGGLFSIIQMQDLLH